MTLFDFISDPDRIDDDYSAFSQEIQDPRCDCFAPCGNVDRTERIRSSRRLTPLLSFLGTKSDVVEAHSLTLINSLGSLGLLFLMTLAGMEADFKLIRNSRRPVIALSVLTFLIPSVSGYLVYACFKADDFPGKLLYASLFASHSDRHCVPDHP